MESESDGADGIDSAVGIDSEDLLEFSVREEFEAESKNPKFKLNRFV